jgi:hypothetical protein
MQRARITVPLVLLSIAAALSLGACGGGSTTTVTQATAAPTTPTTTAATTTSTTPKPPTTTSTTGTSTSASASCTNGQVYDSVAKTCVTPNPSGNPCPQGEVPMADRPVCVRQSARD